jgi:multiple sugar transport system substrate-binding protein
MKKKILTLVLASTLALTSGCGAKTDNATTSKASESSKAAQQTASAGKTKVRISWWGNQTRNDRTVAAIELYEKLNPNIDIEYDFADWSTYWDKIATQAAGGKLSDIVQHDYSYLTQYVNSKQLADLTPYTKNGKLDVSKVSESILAGGTLDGKLYALCLGTNAPTMIYDKEIVKQAGVEIPKDPTIEQIYDLGKTIYEKTGARTLYDGGMNMLTMMARAQGDDFFKTVKESNPKYIEQHLQYVQNFAEAKWAIPADILAEKNPDVVETKPILDKTTWNDFAFSNMYISISKATGRDLEMTTYPQPKESTKENMYLKPSMFFTVAETSQNKDEAVKFINWFTNDIDCNKILMGERGIPVASNVADAIKAQVDAQTVKIFDYVAYVTKTATTIDPPNPKGSGEVEAYAKNLVEKIRFGSIKADAASKDLAKQAKKILDEAAK